MAVQRTFYKGKKELTMAEFEAIIELDPNIDYDITDYPTTSITNAQMVYALTCSKLFPAGTTFICADEGNYTQGTTYQILVNGSTKSWVAISKSSEPIAEAIRDNTTQIVNVNGSFSAGNSNVNAGYSVGIGYGAKISNNGSYGVAIGNNTSVQNGLGIAIGTNSNVKGNRGIAFQQFSYANADYSIQFGNGENNKAHSLQIEKDNIYDAQNHIATFQNLQIDGVDEYPTLSGADAPTTTTVGKVKQFYVETTTPALYYCSSITGTGTTEDPYVYNWTQAGGADEELRNNTVQITSETNSFLAGGASIINPSAYSRSVVIGRNATGHGGECVALGYNSDATAYGVAIGSNAESASNSGIAIGYNAKCNKNSIQMGTGTNNIANSVQVINDNIYKFDTHTLTVNNILQNNNLVYGILQSTSAPTETTVGNLSQVYFDTVNERYYICTKVETDKYTWKEIAVLEQVTLSGENGTLTDYEYNLLTLYETTKIIRSGVEFKRQAKPINGSGKYVYASTYYSEANGGTSEEYATYIILIDPDDKSWKFVLKNNPSAVTDAVLYSAQALTQEQKDQACANIGINNKNYIEITDVPETATEGTITDTQLATLQASNTSYILFNHEKYDLQDIQTAKGYLIFTHKGEDSTDNMFTKCIAVTISTKAWKLKIQGTDDAPTENSTNLITSGAVYAANELKADANASNIDYASFAEKLNIEQSFNLNDDGSKTIRFGNLLMQTKEMTISANSSATFTFTVPFDADHVLCWCNSAASAQSSNNTAAVTEYSTTSMTVRVTNADSVVTMFAIGWKAN